MSIVFTLNNGKSISLGKENKKINVVIHDDTKMETPTSLAISYTVDVFRKAGITKKPDFEKYKDLPNAICQSDVLIRTELCSIGELIDKAWYEM